MWYVVLRARTFVSILMISLAVSSCSLRILGIDKNEIAAQSDGSDQGGSSDGVVNDFSVLGVTGGADTVADALFTDDATPTVNWVDTSGEASYEVSILDSSGSTLICGPVSLAADTTSYAFNGCALSHGVDYRAQVTAKGASSGASRVSQASFQVGPFLSINDVTTDEWGVASIPVSLSYAVSNPVTFQYVTQDGSALGGTDYAYASLSTFTIPAGQTSVKIPVSVFRDYAKETSETFRVELSAASGAALQSFSAQIILQDSDLAPASGYAQVGAGNTHTCALTTAGGVKCWGSNSSGQLGDNTTVEKAVPTEVLGLASGVIQIAVGASHSCALTSAGEVKCWGYNGFGQIGDNSFTNRSVPTQVFGLASGVAQISCGASYVCAVLSTGEAKCWGYNAFGQLGDNTTVSKNVPTSVSGLSSGVASVTGGNSHSCAIMTAGGLKCWGANSAGQIGDNTSVSRYVPADVSGLSSGVSQVALGTSHTCVITTAGGVKCWGGNSTGALGDNTTASKWVPTDVPGLSSGFSQVEAAGYHSCALASTGAVKCWGNNDSGEIGDGSTTDRLVPTDVSSLTSGVTQISARSVHTCALLSTGAIRCWGSAGSALGNGMTSNRLTAADVVDFNSGSSEISAGTDHTCVVSTLGGVKCWGKNTFGQIGDNSVITHYSPVDVFGLTSGMTKVATAVTSSCALSSTGAVKCWGGNSYGQLGNNSGTMSQVPVDAVGLSSGVVQIASKGSHSCALTSAGGVKCWGLNSSGQLGDGSTTNRLVPVDVSGLTSGVIQIATGSNHTCALTSAGGVKCWGFGLIGQLGNNSTANQSTPVDSLGLTSGVTGIAAGEYHTCALTSGGGVKCWGSNAYGQLGDNTGTARVVPTDVFALSAGITQVVLGDSHTCALTSGGAVKCWGKNLRAQLGDATLTDRWIPTDVSGLASGIRQISAGGLHTCAVTVSGSAKCWGSNSSAQVGDAYPLLVPTWVVAP